MLSYCMAFTSNSYGLVSKNMGDLCIGVNGHINLVHHGENPVPPIRFSEKHYDGTIELCIHSSSL